MRAYKRLDSDGVAAVGVVRAQQHHATIDRLNEENKNKQTQLNATMREWTNRLASVLASSMLAKASLRLARP